MAGDWIKLRTDLQTDPAVIRLAAVLKLDAFGVIGRLAAVWVWADTHADRHGHVTLVSRECLDSITQCAGFGAALEAVGWLQSGTGEGGGITFPRFERHMGEGAKQRAQAAKRKQNQRARESRAAPEPGHAPVTLVSRWTRDTSVTREEKRREEEEDPPNPPRAGGGGGSAAPVGTEDLRAAVAEVTGLDPATAARKLDPAVAALAKADPPYTPAEVREFGRRFLKLCPWAAKQNRDRPTPKELAERIGLVRAKPATRAPPGRAATADEILARRKREEEAAAAARADLAAKGLSLGALFAKPPNAPE